MKSSPWPDLRGVDLAPTLTTLHLWTQVVGKVRLMLTPWENHGWHVPLYLSARGFVTGLVLAQKVGFTAEFDLVSAELIMRTTAGAETRRLLASGSVADFYEAVLAFLKGAGADVSINPMPSELTVAIPFDQDRDRRPFEPDVARQYWRAMIEAQRVFQLFRTRFTGKVSPIHLFWGAFDLVITRFSGREAPAHPGGAPYLNDAVMREAYSREVSSAGFWPNLGSSEGPCFYSYAYPVPEGYAARTVMPPEARYDATLGEFIFPYAAARESDEPDRALLDFLQTTYEAAADLAGWDRQLLEREQGLLGKPPEGS
ncbi:DUF5996 family protein [Lichenicoccus sp.]|uniref:DUF5996 family protein n=1 Tax=Lichenicoccus sp. TaxID=2781899 RepID=UPI003D0B7B6F